MHKKTNVLWGIIFILAALLIIFRQLGFFHTIGLPTLIFTVLLIPVIIMSITRRSYAGVFFPLAILCILYDDLLGTRALTPWPVLLIALFFTVGLTLLFPQRKWHKPHLEEGFDTVIDEADPDVIQIEAHFSGSVKYINTDQLRAVNIDGSFGGVKVYFDHANIAGDSATVHVDLNCSGAELYFPKTWRIIDNVNYTMGGLDERGPVASVTDKTITLNGRANLSGITIIHI